MNKNKRGREVERGGMGARKKGGGGGVVDFFCRGSEKVRWGYLEDGRGR